MWVTGNQVGLVRDENNNIWTERKGQIWHFSGVRDKGTYRLYTLEPEATSVPVLSIFTSITEGRFIHLSAVTLFHFFSLLRSAARAESIEFQKHWVHRSRKYAPNTALLWPAVTPAPCFGRGYQLEQRWPWLRPVGHPGGAAQRAGEKTWVMDIFKLYLGDGT